MQVTLIHLEDRPRPGVLDVIVELRDQAKLRVMMLTGDHQSSAWRVANAVGINEVYCSLKPEDKLSHVKDVSRNMGEFSFQRSRKLHYLYVLIQLECYVCIHVCICRGCKFLVYKMKKWLQLFCMLSIFLHLFKYIESHLFNTGS